MPVSAGVRARLHAALTAGGAAGTPARRGNGLAMFVGGLPRVMVQDTAGHLTDAGREWIAMGGPEPVAFPQPLQQNDGQSRFITENGRRRLLQRWNPVTHAWENTRAGHLRFRAQNEWSVVVPVIGHEELSDGVRTWEDELVITDNEILPAFRETLRDLGVVHANRSVEEQKAFIAEAVRRYLLAQDRDPNGEVILKAFGQSDVWWTVDEAKIHSLDGFQFDLKYTKVSDDRPRTEVILNRPAARRPGVPRDAAEEARADPPGLVGPQRPVRAAAADPLPPGAPPARRRGRRRRRSRSRR